MSVVNNLSSTCLSSAGYTPSEGVCQERVQGAIEDRLPQVLMQLTCDYASPSINVSALIKYPGNPFISLAKVGNQITAEDITQVRELSPDVSYLDLSGCRLTASLVAEITKLRSLEILILSNFDVTKVSEDDRKLLLQLTHSPSLKRLDLHKDSFRPSETCFKIKDLQYVLSSYIDRPFPPLWFVKALRFTLPAINSSQVRDRATTAH